MTNVIGLMSGTSLDGLDVISANFYLKNGNYKFEILHAETFQYDDEYLSILKIAHLFAGKDLIENHRKYGVYCGEIINNFISKHQIKPILIGSHGHTVFHEPQNNFNFQLGSGVDIFAKTGIKTISDFRSLDISLGGQGAPLVPIGDKLLFPEYVACVNLGGFANISFDDNNGKRVAFDICPVNFLINHFAQKIGFDYDKDGNIATQNTADEKLLGVLNNLEFYKKNPPKSLAREWIEEEVLSLIGKRKDYSTLISTFTHHAAIQIANVLNNNNIEKGKVLFTGGGSFNLFLIKLIQEKVKKDIEIIVPEPILVNFKEALIFAFLAYLRINGKTNVLKEVTGASSDSSSGTIDG
jgi:anhydro-N-acetylmuramic acid kinase